VLIFGRWTVASDDLIGAAHAASSQLVDTVRAAEEPGALPDGPAERLTALPRAPRTAHGTADREAAGHPSSEGKGRSDAVGLVVFAGEDFVDLAELPRPRRTLVRQVAGPRIHGTTRARPAEVFAEHEAPLPCAPG
jgi:hypothetical protein